jgi:hypothetical protein
MRVAQPPSEEVERLRDENARLVALLEANGIEWRLPPKPEPLAATAAGMGRHDPPQQIDSSPGLLGNEIP